jgi:hypothetical protein
VKSASRSVRFERDLKTADYSGTYRLTQSVALRRGRNARAVYRPTESKCRFCTGGDMDRLGTRQEMHSTIPHCGRSAGVGYRPIELCGRFRSGRDADRLGQGKRCIPRVERSGSQRHGCRAFRDTEKDSFRTSPSLSQRTIGLSSLKCNERGSFADAAAESFQGSRPRSQRTVGVSSLWRNTAGEAFEVSPRDARITGTRYVAPSSLISDH